MVNIGTGTFMTLAPLTFHLPPPQSEKSGYGPDGVTIPPPRMYVSAFLSFLGRITQQKLLTNLNEIFGEFGHATIMTMMLFVLSVFLVRNIV